ncbi:MAG TPA: extracellular solute-binding protein [Methylomirabilota bacterium]|jgi:multiple sugar transport system substrate-binding protein|nr:extracellular solute-binding protein [Methylomirabilota bacterium]
MKDAHASALRRRDLLTRAAQLGVGLAVTGGLPSGIERARAQSGSLRFYMIPQHRFETYQKLFADFGKEKNVRLQPEVLELDDMRAKLLATAAAGGAPDMSWENNWSQEFAMRGLVHPLTAFLERDGRELGYPDDWLPRAVERHTYKGTVYGLQNFYTNMCLFYNKKLLAQAGIKEPPRTWDEFLEAALKTTKRQGDRTEVWGFASVYRFFNGFLNWYYQAGAEWYNPRTNRVVTDSAESLAAFQFFHDLIWKHRVAAPLVVEPGIAQPRKLFTSERAAMILSGPWDLKPVQQEGPQLEWGVALPLSGKRRATIQAGTGLFILKNSPNKELGWELIKRLLRTETMVAVTRETNFVFPRKSWAASPDVQGSPVIKVFAEAAPSAVDWNAGIRLSGKPELYTTMMQALVDEVAFDKKPVKEAVQEYTEKANKLLGG